MNQQKILLAIVTCILGIMILLVVNRYNGFDLVLNFIYGAESTDGMPESSLQQSVSICKQAARTSIGADLIQMDVDELSTRYDARSRGHLVFINLVLRGQEREEYYLECNVSAVTQEIRRIRVTGPPANFSFFN